MAKARSIASIFLSSDPSQLACMYKDALLAFDPLSVAHVKRCNEAEAEFWRRSEGYQTKDSDKLLQFDCGGQVNWFPAFHFNLISKNCSHNI